MKPQFKIIYLFILLAFQQLFAQQAKEINIKYGGDFTKDEIKYPGAEIMSNDGRQVQFEHDGMDMWCDVAVFYRKDNKLKAFGNVYFQQGDSIKMNSEYAEYDGLEKTAYARENVELRNNTMTLNSEAVWFDRKVQEAYYQTFSTIKDSANVLTSEKGRYYMIPKKYEFKQNVRIVNPEYELESSRLDYYTNSKNAYMYGPSTITGKDYRLYCERGFYDTSTEQGYGLKNTRIDYNNRIIRGDSVYFDKTREFASATNNIKVTDTINKGVVKGHYAEVYKAMDSVFVTKRAVAINLVEKDSVYIHGDTLMVTGKENERLVRAFHNARFFKKDLSGKCDSISSVQKTGITRLIRNPILWNGHTQMTGDSILILSDLKTDKLDSLKVLNNAFVISKDTLGTGFNQIKGKDLFGKFIDNTMKKIDMVKNAELIYYMRDEPGELIGIDKRKCGRIEFTLENNQIDEITSFINVEGDIFPEKDLPENARKFRGFVWKGDEMILSKEDIFDEDDNNLSLPVIKGVNNPIDIDDPDISLDEADPTAKPEEDQGSKIPPAKSTAPTRKADSTSVKKKGIK